MMHYRTAVALQEEKLRQAAGLAARSREVDDSSHGMRPLTAAPLIHRLINTLAELRKMSGRLMRRTSWSQTK